MLDWGWGMLNAPEIATIEPEIEAVSKMGGKIVSQRMRPHCATLPGGAVGALLQHELGHASHEFIEGDFTRMVGVNLVKDSIEFLRYRDIAREKTEDQGAWLTHRSH